VGASLLAMAGGSLPGLWERSEDLSDASGFFRRVLAVAGWEGVSLVFSRRCKIQRPGLETR
jgi:hypothetical protein